MKNLNRILGLDALTCVSMGLVLVAAAPTLSTLLSLPQHLLFYAGCVLFPIAAFMALLARQAAPWPAGVWLLILGNVGWVVASLVVLADTAPNSLGVGFVGIQGLVVALLALAEFNALNRRHASIA